MRGVSGRYRDRSDSFLPRTLLHCTKETRPGPEIDKDLQFTFGVHKGNATFSTPWATKYLWTETGPAWFRFNPMLVSGLKLSQYCGVACFQDLNIVSVSVPWEERDTGNVWQEEEMGLLYCRMIIQSHLCGGNEGGEKSGDVQQRFWKFKDSLFEEHTGNLANLVIHRTTSQGNLAIEWQTYLT